MPETATNAPLLISAREPAGPPPNHSAAAEEWAEIHRLLDFHFRKYGREMEGVRKSARRCRENIERLFPIFDGFCVEAIRKCTAVCCAKAIVEFDFIDFLFWHALDLTPPPHRIIIPGDDHCRYLASEGCRLDRLMRPFVCTWFYCEHFLEIHFRQPAREQRRQSAWMSAAQTARREMEDEFVRVVMG